MCQCMCVCTYTYIYSALYVVYSDRERVICQAIPALGLHWADAPPLSRGLPFTQHVRYDCEMVCHCLFVCVLYVQVSVLYNQGTVLPSDTWFLFFLCTDENRKKSIF